MAVNIRTIKDIRSLLAAELKDLYPENELSSLYRIITATLAASSGSGRQHFPDEPVSPPEAERVSMICRELASGKPIQYILGETEFYGLRLLVSPAALIPRQETEELADLIIKDKPGFSGNILDFGTGTGCIAIALAAKLPAATVIATDISDEALALADANAKLNKVKIRFILNDMLSPSAGGLPEAGIIVSNPPYIRNSEKSLMHRNVLEHEPHKALFVNDSDPLVFYRAILDKTAKLLKPGASVYFEINEALGREMTELTKSYPFSEVSLIKDLNGRDRILRGTGYGRI